jgi:hypothetical protein
MNVEIGAEAALFPEKEYINGIAVAVRTDTRAQARPNCLLLEQKKPWIAQQVKLGLK